MIKCVFKDGDCLCSSAQGSENQSAGEGGSSVQQESGLPEPRGDPPEEESEVSEIWTKSGHFLLL